LADVVVPFSVTDALSEEFPSEAGTEQDINAGGAPRLSEIQCNPVERTDDTVYRNQLSTKPVEHEAKVSHKHLISDHKQRCKASSIGPSKLL
jgi:hypothetical protein